MPQIRIDTEHTREIARRFLAESDHLAEIGHELQNAIGGLDTWAWDGRSRSRAEPLLSRVRPESARAASVLDELGRKLTRVADTFEQKDNSAAGKLAAMPWVDFEAAPTSFNLGASQAVIPLSVALLGSNIGGDYTVDYANARASGNAYYSSDLTTDEYYEEARKRVGKKKMVESDAHYEWRIEREIEYLHWLDDRVADWEIDYLRPVIDTFSFVWGWNEHEKKWRESNPEPE